MIPCTACGTSGTKQEPFRYEWNGREFWLRRCSACTHQFVFPFLTSAELAQLYNDVYFEDGTWISGIFEKRYVDSEPQLRREAREVLGCLTAKGSLLDIGCAGGTFLDEARQAGHGPLHGIELNQKMADHARHHYGLDIVCRRVEEIPANQWTRLDAVVLMDTLEHISEPLALLKKISAWLRPGGQLLIRGPMSNNRISATKEWLRRTLRVVKTIPDAPRDANFWNRRSLTAALRAAGFEAERWWAYPDFANVRATRAGGARPTQRETRLAS
jgi:2-polyprenyl-3-methyl-5-hydroxy-6-metoxy-1,4-benzoquinol methylase